MRRVLLVGGGHAHAWVIREGVAGEVTLVTPYPHHTYSGMLPGYVAGHYAAAEIRIDVAALCARAGVELVLGRVAVLDADKRIARLESGAEIAYDTASLDVGATSNAPDGALPAKPFEPFMARWEEVREGLRCVAVVGSGAAGVEMAMAIAHRTRARVVLYSDRPMFRAGLATRIARQLGRNGVELRNAAYAGESADLVVWTAGAHALPWLRASGLAVDERGFVLVDDRLRSVSHPEVLAAGDCATLRSAPHPKSGVYAVRHAPVLAANLRGEARRYAPQRRALALLSCGARYAIADWGGLSWEGAWVWRWKDRIDRRWVESFRP
ncbi:MAG: FAD-dependent oxidoreductase [Betaproteobacteria bacterium]|nr:FAD-dependent oxidoreductase [Betaproteobacteria bacterium]MDH5222862.1 FAD-dependent oxidoreductase [Betaproteobacteria bacterium]MDH5351589.1 FAD-dependent oxidoreductase [Betaproteobacteria bacterium]